ncbi:MAG: thymidylate synthase [Stackebrandtia sp.]
MDSSVRGAVYRDFNECYEPILRCVYDHPEHIVTARGYDSREVTGSSFTLENPQNRFYFSPVRRANIVFNYAEALWYLSGRDDAAYLHYYAPAIGQFTGGRERLTGTAYGPRIFGIDGDQPSQWERVADALREDPQSRRAVIQIFSGSESLNIGNADVSCTLSLQFLIRDGALDAITYMRANDAYRGMVSDVFSFTLLQEIMAAELGVQVGRYHHHVGSLHIYARDYDMAAQLLDFPITPYNVEFPVVDPRSNVRADIEIVRKIESQLRSDRQRLGDDDVRGLGLTAYWSDVVRLFECYRRVKQGEQQDERLVLSLPKALRLALAHRWPRHFPFVDEIAG